MARVRTRRLWLAVRFKIPKDVPKDTIIRTMIRSIERGDYKLPRGWRAIIEWRNAEDAEMRRGEWTQELNASAESSPGFETALVSWLERERNRG